MYTIRYDVIRFSKTSDTQTNDTIRFSNVYDIQQKYDAILSAAAPFEVPQKLKERLTIGGKLVLPVGNNEQQVLTLVKRISEDEFLEEKLEEVMFVPLLKGVVS